MSRFVRGSCLMAILLLLTTACASRRPPDIEIPEEDDLGAVERALDQSERALTDEGVRVAAPGPEPPPEPQPDAEEEARPQEDAPALESSAGERAVVEGQGSEEPGDARSRRRAARAAQRDNAARCARICRLSETIRRLRDRICAMSERHEGDTRYEAACGRATRQWTRAELTCRRC